MPAHEQTSLKLEPSWKAVLAPQFQQPYMTKLREFLVGEIKKKKKTVFPKGPEYFAALNHTPFDQVKVVIIGQDPYHGPNQAHGLCFSVQPGVKPPPSLVNIYKELKNDCGINPPHHGNLTAWADQGVLLLNAVLTVEQGLAGSHAGKGWELFTDQIIHELNDKREHLVFILWGSYAQKKGSFIDTNKHLVLKSVHPSPLSAHRGFFGSKPFSKTNNYLKAHGIEPINWVIPELS